MICCDMGVMCWDIGIMCCDIDVIHSCIADVTDTFMVIQYI